MTRLAQTLGLTEFQTEIVTTVRQFVDKEVIPTAQELERTDTYPQAIVDQMKAPIVQDLALRPYIARYVCRLLTSQRRCEIDREIA